MTLVEIMVSVGIMVIVVAITMSVVIQTINATRKGEELADTNEAARAAGETLTAAIQNAGAGAPGGIFLTNSPTVAVNPVQIIDNPSGPDEVWLVRPVFDAFGGSCLDGGTVGVSQKPGATLMVDCVPDGGTNTILMATNMRQAALLSGYVAGSSTPLGYPLTGSIAVTNSTLTGFGKGDLVVPVLVEHYFIADGGTAPALWMEYGTTGSSASPVFTAIASSPRRLIQPGIEDLQLAVGVAEPGYATPSDGIAVNIGYHSDAGSIAPSLMRSVRLTLVGISSRAVLDSNGATSKSSDYAPKSVENHTVAAVPDGRRRTSYIRRIEMVNLGVADL